MEKFIIKKDEERIMTNTKTIRIKPERLKEILEVCEKHKISFNKLVNQCVEYALENLKE